MHAFDGEAEGELHLSVGDIVVVRQVCFEFLFGCLISSLFSLFALSSLFQTTS